MDYNLPPTIQELRDRTNEIARERIAPRADEVDRLPSWPAHSLAALGQGGLLGLQVPERLGGLGQGLLALAVTTEAIGQACSSSALCFGMHCVATAVIAAKASPYHEEHYLRPIAAGRHITSLALSESATGSHFYLPRTEIRRRGTDFAVTGEKQFVTSGSHADSYVVSGTTGDGVDAGQFSMVLMDGDTRGIEWLDPWTGLGMRGNDSRGMRLSEAAVPLSHLLGDEGDQVWYVFEVVAPYFLMAISGAYVGIAQALLDQTIAAVSRRRFAHIGQGLGEMTSVQRGIAEMWTRVHRSRCLVYHAAQLGDWGSPDALLKIMAAKVDATEIAVQVADEAMRLGGGRAYAENSQRSRLLRDALAGRIMAPTTETLNEWLGRSLLGLPWF